MPRRWHGRLPRPSSWAPSRKVRSSDVTPLSRAPHFPCPYGVQTRRIGASAGPYPAYWAGKINPPRQGYGRFWPPFRDCRDISRRIFLDSHSSTLKHLLNSQGTVGSTTLLALYGLRVPVPAHPRFRLPGPSRPRTAPAGCHGASLGHVDYPTTPNPYPLTQTSLITKAYVRQV